MSKPLQGQVPLKMHQPHHSGQPYTQSEGELIGYWGLSPFHQGRSHKRIGGDKPPSPTKHRQFPTEQTGIHCHIPEGVSPQQAIPAASPATSCDGDGAFPSLLSPKPPREAKHRGARGPLVKFSPLPPPHCIALCWLRCLGRCVHV